MKKLLFVDDEQPVLDFLRLSLSSLEKDWDMEFVSDAEAALRILAHETVDVVVADIHLAGTSGIHLLQEVKKRSPQTVRIAFTGAMPQESARRALKIAHQVLPKPLTPAMLRASMARACALRDQVTGSALERLVAQIRQLPTLPSLYEELLGVLESPDSSAERVATVIAKDAGMAASILKVANSAYYNIRQPVANVTQAVAVLGIENVKSLVLGCQVYRQVKEPAASGSSIEEVWRHGFAVATQARAIASLEDAGGLGIESAFLAGLLHDVGRIVLQTNLPREYETVRRYTRERRVSLSAAELDVFGATHAQLSAHLLGLWGLRDTIVEAVAFHHEPALCPVKGFSILAAVHVADALDHERHPSRAHDSLLDQQYLAQAGLEALLPRWRAALAA